VRSSGPHQPFSGFKKQVFGKPFNGCQLGLWSSHARLSITEELLTNRKVPGTLGSVELAAVVIGKAIRSCPIPLLTLSQEAANEHNVVSSSATRQGELSAVLRPGKVVN
jgi:hypothetical protein